MRISAGILVFRRKGNSAEFFLVHPGGPFWKDKDAGAWTIPKGEIDKGEEPFSTAIREFSEETGQQIEGDFRELAPVKQKGGKLVYAWAVEGNVDADNIRSNTFKVEWPYKSGKWRTFPEVDKAGWFSAEQAKIKINSAQVSFIEQVMEHLGFR